MSEPGVPEHRQFRIPVSFGHIAAVEWGPSDGRPVLALHGWLDNAMSFVPLARLLAGSGIRLVAIDLPGHGLSSHFGLGATYTHLQYASAVWQVVQELRWDSFTLIGHSMGGIVAIICMAFFPQRVTSLVTLDSIYPELPRGDNINRMEDVLSRIVSMEEREKGNLPREMDLEEARESFSGPRALSPANIEVLMQRALQPGSRDGLFVFNRDHRVRLLGGPQFRETQGEPVMGQFAKYRGHWLALMADSAKLRRNWDKLELVQQAYSELMPSFQVIVVPDEGHYFHMEHPEMVAPHVKRLVNLPPPPLLSKL